LLATLAFSAATLTVAGFKCERLGPASAPIVIGVELPLAGDDAFRGLAAQDGVRFALARWNQRAAQKVAALLCDSATHIQNPHADEGSDDPAQGKNGAALVRAFAAESSIVAVVGGLRSDIAASEAPVAQRASLALLSASTTPVRGAATFFRAGHSDEAEAAEASMLAARAHFGVPTVSSRDSARAAAMRALLGPAVRSGATLFAGPAETGSILAGAAESDALEHENILVLMERRGFAFPSTAGAAFAIASAAGLPTQSMARYQQSILAAYGAPALDDTLAYDDAMTIALSASDDPSAHVARSRAAVVRTLETSAFTTLHGRIRFTRGRAADRACYAVRSLAGSKAATRIECVKLSEA
jgi:hypothetical protein